jgi:hypothetical protein
MNEKKIIKVEFPKGNQYEGSPCVIYYEDNTKENTIADTAYMRAFKLNMSKEQMKEVGL